MKVELCCVSVAGCGRERAVGSVVLRLELAAKGWGGGGNRLN